MMKGSALKNFANTGFLVHGLCVGLLLVITLVAFFSGRDGPWLLDDKHNIVNLQNLQPAFVAQQPLWRTAQVNDEWQRRSLTRLSFGLTVKTCGLSPVCFKTTNIVLQALTAIAVYIFCLQLLKLARHFCDEPDVLLDKEYFYPLIAFTVAAIWTLHPIQVSTVLYAVQRMTILSTLFVLMALICYLYWRKDPTSLRAKVSFVLACLAAFCAWHSKENAVVLPLLILCVEVFVLRPRVAVYQQYWFIALSLVLVSVGLFVGLHLLGNASFFEDFSSRPFSPWERLLSEFRILWYYLYWILLPDTSHYTLFHDDIAVSENLLQPRTTLLALLALAGVSAGLFYMRRVFPLLAFGWFWFLAAHSVESTFLGLELIFEHRNHLPLVGLLFGVVATVFVCLQKYLPERRIFLWLWPAFAILYCGAITAEKSYQWRSDGSMLEYESRFHPHSVRLNYKIGFLWLQLGTSPGIDAEQRQSYLNMAEAAYRAAHTANVHNLHGTIGLLYMQGQGLLAVEEDLWPMLYARLQTAPMSADGANLLQVLSACYLERRCNFAKQKLQRAYELYLARSVKTAAQHNAQQMLLRLRATNP